ncbi:MAG TPA: hypothetical protein VFO76_08970, partial [Candidatus Kapabacteria bacterium]|nr:hypothetical protein [Candidatus Kapabacteria bacterium]
VNYHENTGAGLTLSSTSTIDMSGVDIGADGSNDYPAYNNIWRNNTGSASTTGQIKVGSGSRLKVGIGSSGSSFSEYGHNNIVCNSTSDLLIHAPSSYTFYGADAGIDDNFWGQSSSWTPIHVFSGGHAQLANISYTSVGSDPNFNTSAFPSQDVSCGVGFDNASNISNAHPQVQSPQDSTQDCAKLDNIVHSYSQGSNYQKMYDTAKYCIEHCPTFNGVWHDFTVSTTGCEYMGGDNTKWPVYREWLKKVLYLNMDSFYYCADVQALLSTFYYFEGRGFDQNGALAVVKFLLDSGKCFGLMPDLNENWKHTRLEQYNIWRDTVGDPRGKSPDTTLPSLEDLDLQILRGPQYAAVKNAFTPSTSKKILSLTASENPFTDETTLHFGLSDKEYMKLEVFDLLGEVVYSSGGLFTEGDGSLRIAGKGIPRGQLYARLSTMGGEVMTIKLVKE